ncbi:MAG: 4-hydroxy-4-methyl-2-oxoglutarate aldolase [Verrucomicrobiales bacterium]|jgi:4-hydroxy-4-methyl-2-oxoglutarate aldolase
MPNTSLPHSDLLELKRWNTPTIFNGWEQVTNHDVANSCINLEETRDFMPDMGPMIGRAVTVRIRHKSAEAKQNADPSNWRKYIDYVANLEGPKIVIVKDDDEAPFVGSFWGEVNSNTHKALGCVGTITDGCIRDLDEMNNAGFKALARRLCVGHGYGHVVEWGEPVEVFGTTIEPGQLVHADKHGFLAIPAEDEEGLLDAARFMDTNECKTLIPVARSSAGRSTEETLAGLFEALDQFSANVREKFVKGGEFE